MELFYRKMGNGPPIVILHGLYGSSENWLSIGKELSKDFEVFLIDARNHGNSPHTREHNYMLLKNDLLNFLDQQNIKKAILLGHSMGGKTVMFFAADYPERVQSLIIIDISPRSYKDLTRHVPQSVDHMNIIQAMYSLDFSIVENRPDVEKQLTKSISSPRIRQFLLKSVKRDKSGTYSWKLNVKTLRDQLPEILDGLDVQKFRNGKGITGFPVLLVKGEKSDYIGPEDISLVHEIFPSVEIASIPGAGHWLHAEKPSLLVKTIRYFILGNGG